MATESDHPVEVLNRQFSKGLGLVSGHIHSGLGQGLHCLRAQTVLFDTGGIDLDSVAFQKPRPVFRQLAATGVAGTEETNFCASALMCTETMIMVSANT